MILGYVTLGTNNIEAARGFYGALFAEVDGKEVMKLEDGGFTLYAAAPGSPGVAITMPHDGKPATVGNGNMTAIMAPSRAKVDALHAKALELGGTDEGAPGLRGDDGPQAFYAAYFRDLDGNKLCAFAIGPEG